MARHALRARRGAAALACALLLACCVGAAPTPGRSLAEGPWEGLAASHNASAAAANATHRALLGFFSGSGAAEVAVDPQRIEKIGYIKARGLGGGDAASGTGRLPPLRRLRRPVRLRRVRADA